MTSTHIDFKDLPGYSKLFLDFLHDFPSVESFYSSCSMSIANVSHCVQTVLRNKYPRGLLVDVLRRQNAGFGAGEVTLRNIERLKDDSTVAVVTGQQVVLFAGPLLTLYKALTAIKVADYLKGLGVSAVPIFWMPSDDHDFAEISRTYFIDTGDALSEVGYELEDSEKGKSVGHIVITQQIEKITERLAHILPQTEFSQAVLNDITACYRAGNTFSGAFAQLLLKLLSQYGLVLIDPVDPDLKRQWAPIFEKAVCRSSMIDEVVQRRNEELAAHGYEIQVHTAKSNTLLFYSDGGKRTPIRMPEEGRFSIADREFSCDDLVAAVKKTPEKFSPNALLRPFVQDVLLPTAAYVGGPAEIAYYAQIQPLYELFSKIEPVIIPRASFTLLEKKTQKTLDKYRLDAAEFFADFNVAFKKATERVLASNAAQVFVETEAVLKEKLAQLEKILTEADPSLISAVTHARDKILYHVRHLETKFVNINARKHETAKAQIEKAWLSIYPNKTMQERVLNPFYFLAKYGRRLVDELYEEIDVERSDHKVLML